jgi:hypothetical protein
MAKSPKAVSLKLVTLSEQKDWIQFQYNEAIRLDPKLSEEAINRTIAVILHMGFEPSTVMVSKLKGEKHDCMVVLPSKQNPGLCNHVIAKQQERRMAQLREEAEERRTEELARIERVKASKKYGKKTLNEMQGLFA